MKIGILQTGRAPDDLLGKLGDYNTLFERLLDGNGFEFTTFAVVDMVFPQAVSDCDGWLITGSRYGAYEDHPWIAPLEQFIRDIHDDGRPLVGICFGHQIIAQALGGKVEKYSGGWSAGYTEYDFDGQIIPLNAWHQDQVVEKPAAAKVIASTDFCKNAALVYGDRIWTVQPHPEFDAAFVDGLLKGRGKGIVPDEILEAASKKLERPTNSSEIAARIAAFFKKART